MHLKFLEEVYYYNLGVCTPYVPISHLFAGIWRQRRLHVYKSQHCPNHGGDS